MQFTSPVAELIRRRRSCRKFVERPLPDEPRRALETALAGEHAGPFGGRARFLLAAGTAEDREALRGLGTYGFIRGVTAFVVGAVARGPRDHEDYGYLLERVILRATDLGLDTCWLGGSFTRSGFARKAGIAADELLPAVAAVGVGVEGGFERDRIRRMAGSNARKPAAELFFDGAFGVPLSPPAAGPYAEVLELVRWAPSASNKQPWRVVRTAAGWHLYLARTKGYGKGTLVATLLRLADLQRVDLGIAMCHFELAARGAGLAGTWVAADPGIALPEPGVSFVATWRPSPAA